MSAKNPAVVLKEQILLALERVMCDNVNPGRKINALHLGEREYVLLSNNGDIISSPLTNCNGVAFGLTVYLVAQVSHVSVGYRLYLGV